LPQRDCDEELAMSDALMGVYNRAPIEAGGGDNCIRLAMAFATTRRRMAHAA